MTPTLGRGANVAMRDGALLGRGLKAVAEGNTTLTEALATYEHAMLHYGFDVVREAARIGQQRMAQNPLAA
jgi:2-polyprenyl-6-methoxyphenol hydroxylase-like FAD-dependent oxidoreductase